MQTFKEHHHTLLVTLFLIGVLFVAGSFEARLPDSAIAANTPGEQSVTKSAIWNSNTAGVHNTVIYTGEVRRGGALVKSDDVLSPGDQLSVKLIENASFFLDGSFNDSPPSPWIDSIVYRPSPPGGSCDSLNTEQCSLYYCIYDDGDCKNLLPAGQYSPIAQQYISDNQSLVDEYCTGANLEIWRLPGGSYHCLAMGIEKRAPSLSASGLNCGNLSAGDPAHGIREFTTTCNVNTSGPTASLSITAPSTITGPVSNQLSQEAGNIPGVSGPKIVIDSAQLNWTFDVGVPVPPAPTLTFFGNPTTINQGQSATLTWTSQNTTNCTASGGWSGSKATSGSESVSPSSTATFTLTCTGPGGSVSSSVTITVNPVTPPPPPPLQPSGSSCSSSSQCQSGICQSGSCVSGTGGSCSSSSQCQSGICQSGSCVSGAGGSCSSSSQCQSSFSCSGGQCLGTVGASCASSALCLPGLICAGGVCANPPDFSLNSSNDISVNVTGVGSGTSNSSQITVTPFSGFSSAVALSIQSVSPNLQGASYSLSPASLNQSQYSSGSTFQITVPGSTIPGSYTITVQGIGGGLTRTVDVILQVNSVSPVFREI